MRRALCIQVACLLTVSGCGSGASRVPINVPDAPKITEEHVVAQEVGRLLSPDPRASESARRRLLNQTDDGRRTLLVYAATIPDERDPRWLDVLDEQGALPELTTDEELSFLLWKARKGDRFHVMKSQGRLIEIASTEPGAVLERLDRSDAGSQSLLVMSLGLAEQREAVPALLQRYLASTDDALQRAVVESLAMIAGEARRPRERGTIEEMRSDAGRIRRWYRHQLALEAARAEDTGTPGSEVFDG